MNFMKKTRVLWIILDLIFLVVFNLLFFTMAGFKGHPASVWISYGFIHLAYALLLLTPCFVVKGKSEDVFRYSLDSISSVYFMVELVAGVIFILVKPLDWKGAMIVQVILLALYAFILLVNMLANEKTAANEAKAQGEIRFVKTAIAQLEGIMNSVSDKDIRKLVEKAYDAARSCQTKSNPQVAALENGMVSQIGAIQREVFAGDKANIEKEVELFVRMTAERERQLRILA